jgi:hypothetical protein
MTTIEAIKAAQKQLSAKSKNLDLLVKTSNKEAKKVIKSEILRIEKEGKEKQKAYLKERANKFKMSVKEYKSLLDKADLILKSFHTGHSMGCYRRIKIGDQGFSYSNVLDTYSKACKYKPTYGDIIIHLTKKELKQIELIEGVWTIKQEDNKCLILQSSGSKATYRVSLDPYYLVNTSHATTLEEAQRLDLLKKSQNRKLCLNSFVGYDHIKQLGACDVGIKSFASKYGLNLNYGYSLLYLLSLSDSVGDNYFKRLI